MQLENAVLLSAVYLLGGITFVPFVCLLAYLGSRPVQPRSSRHDPLISDANALTGHEDDKVPLSIEPTDDENVAAGYFAVCREYVPGGINGKPPERMTPAGAIIATENPTMYQNIYRSMFERKTYTPAQEQGAPLKRAANVFFVVLRHGHLMLFDNADQIEVRHVISLSLYDVSVQGDNDSLPEGELWIKRNAIKLSKHSGSTSGGGRPALYLFCDNCSEKEDFYHTLLRSKRNIGDVRSNMPPEPLRFEAEHIFKLIRQLHASEDNIQTRWLNALVGRVFLALYKTAWLQDLVKAKIGTKISRVSKPAFVSSISLTDVDLGDSAPVFAKPKLKEMGVDGSLTLEADIKYTGNFRAVIGAVVRIELGQRFRPREMDLVLAGILNKLEGHLLVHIKPPPSNRLWISFETAPRMELRLEPIVSSRQITLGIILRAIESRIREVVSETLVLPNWDDLSFIDTVNEAVRGGIWQWNEVPDSLEASKPSSIADDEVQSGPQGNGNAEKAASVPRLPPRATVKEIKHPPHELGDPALVQEAVVNPPSTPRAAIRSATLDSPAFLHSRRVSDTPLDNHRSSADFERKSSAEKSIRRRPVHSGSKSTVDLDRPVEALRNVALDPKTASTVDRSHQVPRAMSMTELEGSSQPVDDPEDVTEDRKHIADPFGVPSFYSTVGSDRIQRHNPSAESSADPEETAREYARAAPTKKTALNHAFTSAAASARRWGLAAVQRQSDAVSSTQQAATLTSAPYGRGQPLPPPGEPLPGPQKHTWTASTIDTLKRRAGSISETPKRPTT